MNRTQLEHIIRAAGTIANTDSIIVIGSQAILASVDNPVPELAMSMEADVYPNKCPELSDLIDGCIGELSPFHEQFGYYAQGVGPETAILPKGWQERLVSLANENTNGVTGWCLHPIDIMIAKLAAGREKDFRYAKAVIDSQILTLDDVSRHVVGIPKYTTVLIRERLNMLTKSA